MKRILKIVGLLIGLFFIGMVIFLWSIHQTLPEGGEEVEADQMAKNMLQAINFEAYEQTRFLEWSFNGGNHHYRWDKERGICEVRWNDTKVNLALSQPTQSEVFVNGIKIHGVEKEKPIEKAVKIFNNDSFWLVAPFKVFDEGTSRKIVTTEDGREGLLVTYSSGGTTPGDSYLWFLDENHIPKSYKMWVKIIPVGGLEATWEEWKTFETGVQLPQSHKLGPIELSMGTVEAYNE